MHSDVLWYALQVLVDLVDGSSLFGLTKDYRYVCMEKTTST